MEEKGFVRLEGRARKKKLAPRRLSKAEFDGDAPDDIGDNDTNDGEDEEDESHPIYDLSQNKVHQEKLAPGLASQELPPGITLKDLKDAFAMFDFDGSGAFLPP